MADAASERYFKSQGPFGLPASVQLGVSAAAAKIWKGTMVAALLADGYAVKAGVAAGGPVQGMAEATVDNSAGADADLSVNCIAGAFWLKNSAAADEITIIQAGVRAKVYAVDNQTVAKTSSAGTRALAGIVLAVDSDRGVLVYINPALNAALNVDLQQGSQMADFQSGTLTLVAGTQTKSAGIVLAAESEVIVYPTLDLTGSTNFACCRELVASRTNGADGVAEFVLQAVGSDGALDVDAAGAVRYVILTPIT
jgi:hypothetical protein